MPDANTRKIIKPTPVWCYVAGLAGAFVFLHLMTLCFSGLVRPDTTPHELPYSKALIEKTAASRTIPSSLDVLPRASLEISNDDYALAAAFSAAQPEATPDEIEAAVRKGEAPAWYPRNEAPVLSTLSADGKIPSVAERTGPEPVVMRGSDGIGKYGGTWRRAANSPNDVGVITWRLSNARLFRFSPMGEPIVPHLARSHRMLEDGRVWEVTLRKVRWSDGHPLDADDVMYWYQHETLDKALGSGAPPKFMVVAGEPGKLEKVDERTVRFTFAKPYGAFLRKLCPANVIRASHYLKKYHPTLGDPEFLEAELKKYGLKSKRSLYYLMGGWRNPECPTLYPWIYRTNKTLPPQVFVRNPYYYAVDEVGNQLPYIDRVQFEVMDNRMLIIAAANGDVGMQNRHIRFENYTDLAGRQEQAGTRLLHWVPGTRSEWVIHPNQNRLVVPGEPATAWKAKVLKDKRFRHALSHALNRKKIIDALYHGLSQPVQVEPGPLTAYHHPGLANAFVEYDVDRANALLDEVWADLGTDPNDRVGGFRCTPDGEMLTFYLDFSEFTGMGSAQFVVNDWAKVGIRCIYRQRARTLFYTEKAARNFDFNVWTSESETLPLLSPRCWISERTESNFAIGWGLWFDRGGIYGSEASKRPGNIPVPKDHPMWQSLSAYEQAIRAVTVEERKKHLDRIFEIAQENLWCINVCAAPPPLVIRDAGMRNVPDKAMVGATYFTPGNTGIETYYFEDPDHSAAEDTIHQLNHIVPLPVAGGSAANGSTGKRILWGLITAVALALLVLLCLRHPFVLRRLGIMVPTLLVISICVFTIIQLPPGDFLTTRLMQLEESGATQEQIDDQLRELKSMFRFDQPAWIRYLHWMGFKWFVTFDPEDKGLLQGDMGRSMETTRSVNDMVGDRITLTFLISLGTVLFTWALAIPIGIFSACRQYSVGDYVFTLLGFLGMCIPPFLLALILMALTGTSGLFSAKYAVQPFWSWGKVLDLLKHIWIPVLVMGISGTAGMIRIMRANLLDELRKPYVTTARAKGLRPIRLLMKYPVRLALNPFISGIGGIFPHLVSGSSIVAIVMNLPTVGPLMLNALFSQDMNMAGSMLMVLSLLGVFGTLVSDLLLLALDPRIRMGGEGAK